MDPLIISCAVTGDQDAQRYPSVPGNPEEIGESAVEAWKEGAAIVHLHARDDDGTPAGELEYFRRAVDVIRSSGSDVVINLTTSYGGADENIWDVRFGPLELNPELASFDCGTLNFDDAVFRNDLNFLRELGKRMKDAGVKPELEIFDAGMIGTVKRLAEEGILEEPLYFQFVLGIAGGAGASEQELFHLRSLIPDGSPWSVCAASRYQLPMNALAIATGGHARTGLEDNLYYRKGELADNPRLVERVRRLSEIMERPVATPDQAREILHLQRVKEVA